MDSIAMKTLPKKFAKEAPVLIRRKRLTSTGEVLETQDCLDSVVIGNDIFQCVLTGDEESVRSYLKSGKNPNLRNKNGNSLLHLAVDGGDADIVEMFLCDGDILWFSSFLLRLRIFLVSDVLFFYLKISSYVYIIFIHSV